MSSFVAAPRNNLLGALCAVGAAACFSTNDMAIKFLSGGYALHQVIVLRSILSLAILLGVAMVLSGGLVALRTRRPGMHVLRCAFILGANTMFFMGLAELPLADVTALFFVGPLVIAALSFAVLGERVGPWRWAAVGIGLAGVVVMLRPGGETFQLAALFPVGAAVCYAGVSLVTRRIGGTERAITMALYTHIAFLLTGLSVGLVLGDGRFAGQGAASMEFLLRAWSWPDAADLPVLLLVGVASAGGALLSSQAYRIAEPGLAAPFEYVALPLAVLWGVIVFGDFPDAVAWAGMALIAAGGLLLIWRETVNARAHRSLPPGPDPR